VKLPAFAAAFAGGGGAFAGALRPLFPKRLNPEELFMALFALAGALGALPALAGRFAFAGALEGNKLFKNGTFCATVFAPLDTELNMLVAASDTALTVPAAAFVTVFITEFTAPTAPEESGEDISLPCCARLISI
jgi:hypothetical protein